MKGRGSGEKKGGGRRREILRVRKEKENGGKGGGGGRQGRRADRPRGEEGLFPFFLSFFSIPTLRTDAKGKKGCHEKGRRKKEKEKGGWL